MGNVQRLELPRWPQPSPGVPCSNKGTSLWALRCSPNSIWSRENFTSVTVHISSFTGLCPEALLITI